MSVFVYGSEFEKGGGGAGSPYDGMQSITPDISRV